VQIYGLDIWPALTHLWLDGLALFASGSILLSIAARRFQNKVIMA
jgi:hypothetical protein